MGSEMCIRDSKICFEYIYSFSVSYTHLTLPPVCRVEVTVVAGAVETRISVVCHSLASRPGTQISTASFFQAEDGIRDVERSRGLGDVYKRQ